VANLKSLKVMFSEVLPNSKVPKPPETIYYA